MYRERRLLTYVAILGLTIGAATAWAQENLLRNPSFEIRVRDSGWSGLSDIDFKILERGRQSRTRRFMHDGRFGLKLLPNENNRVGPLRLRYGIYQLLSASEFLLELDTALEPGRGHVLARLLDAPLVHVGTDETQSPRNAFQGARRVLRAREGPRLVP